MGRVFHDFARGIDERPVVTEWKRKSQSCERTFVSDIFREEEVIAELQKAVDELVRRISKSSFEGRTLTLKVKFADFRQITRSITQTKVLQDRADLLPLALQLLEQVDFSEAHPIRLLGVGVSGHLSVDEPSAHQQWRQLELEFLPW